MPQKGPLQSVQVYGRKVSFMGDIVWIGMGALAILEFGNARARL